MGVQQTVDISWMTSRDVKSEKSAVDRLCFGCGWLNKCERTAEMGENQGGWQCFIVV